MYIKNKKLQVESNIDKLNFLSFSRFNKKNFLYQVIFELYTGSNSKFYIFINFYNQVFSFVLILLVVSKSSNVLTIGTNKL